MCFSLFIFLCCFPFCFPVVLLYCIPRCATPSLGRSPRAIRWKNDDLGLVPIFKKKYFTKICDFPFFPLIDIQTVFFQQWNKMKNINMFFFTFHFSLLFPVLFPRCASLLYSPLRYPVVGSKSSSQSLKKWWLRTCAHLPKNIFHKNLWFSIFPFDLYTDCILKQLNKLKNVNMCFSLFIFLCCFPFCFPVVLPYCIPRCTTPSLGRSPRANRWKNDDLGLVPIFKKNIFHKNLWFSFQIDMHKY